MSQWQEWSEIVLWVSNDASCLFDAGTPVDAFDGGEVSTSDGPGSDHYFL